jgi:hypothetical protein
MTDLTTWSPSQVDVALAEIYERAYIAQHEVNRQRRYVKQLTESIDPANHYFHEPRVERNTARLAEQQVVLDAALAVLRSIWAETAPYDAEFDRRGGWTRAWKVLNSNGHIHRSMDCGTCYPTTEFGWLPQVSGSTEDEIVTLAGEGACTICYPSAPCIGPNTLYTATEVADREAKAAEREVKRAAKAAKSLSIDGSVVEVRWSYGENRRGWKDIKTYRAAELFVVECLSYSCVPSYDVAPVETVNEVLDMMAAKKGQPVAEIREALQAKAIAKRAKRAW